MNSPKDWWKKADGELDFEAIDRWRGLSDYQAEHKEPLEERVREFEIAEIKEAHQLARGNVSHTARLLKIPRPTLYRKLKQFGIEYDPAYVEPRKILPAEESEEERKKRIDQEINEACEAVRALNPAAYDM